MLLSVRDLYVSYDHIKAVHGVSFEVEEGEIVTLIGANGAGKSTILNTVAGLQRPDRGEIFYRGANIAGRQAHQTVKLGLALVPEGRRVFGNLTVYENLRLAGFQLRSGEIEQRIRRVYAYFPRLEERKAQLGDTLSGGEQQMLAVGRALVTGGQCMLLDEPSMGLAPILVQQIFEILREINRQGTTILLVEQNAHMALKLAHRAYVLETGNIVLSGPSKEVAASPDVQKAYLGG
jgi:branched-chain amino acid transport system ATP-binding protein